MYLRFGNHGNETKFGHPVLFFVEISSRWLLFSYPLNNCDYFLNFHLDIENQSQFEMGNPRL